MNKSGSGLLYADLRAITIVIENPSFAFQCSNCTYWMSKNAEKRLFLIYTFSMYHQKQSPGGHDIAI